MSANRSIKKKITASLIAAALALTLTTSGCGIFNKDKDENNTALTSKSESVEIVKNQALASSENYSISLPMGSYLFNSYYQNYRQYAVYQGLDVTKSLKEQKYSDTMTWFDYFMAMTKQYLQQILVLCEAANEENIVLEQSDLDNVDVTMKSLREAAENAGVKIDEYIVTNFGGNITEQGLRDYLELTALAQKYYTKLSNSFTYTDEDLEKYYNENPTSYQYADFLHFTFIYKSDQEQSDGSDPELEKRIAEAKASAEELVKVKTQEEYIAWITKYLTEHPDLVSGTSETPLSGDDLTAAVSSATESALYKKYAYEVTSAAGKWVFDLSRKAFDTTIVENEGSYTVFMLIKPAYRDETVSKNVRHILFSAEKYGGKDESALSEATKVYKTWREGEKTEDSFAALVQEYTADSGSKYKGGLYEDVQEGDMVTEFNDWVFDSARKPGDTGIVKTNYGYHLMYFVGDGDPAWKISAESVLRKTDLDNALNELIKKYEVDIDEDAAATIEETEYVSETSNIVSEESSAAETSAAESAAEETSSADTSTADTSTTDTSASDASDVSAVSQTQESKS